MKILISVLTVTLMFSFVVFACADTPLPAPAAMLTVVCPNSVVTGIINAPADWSPLSVLSGAELSFQQMLISKEFGKPIVICAYTNQKDTFAVHTLRRVFPMNYVCSVNKSKTGTDAFAQRSATCAPRIKVN